MKLQEIISKWESKKLNMFLPKFGSETETKISEILIERDEILISKFLADLKKLNEEAVSGDNSCDGCKHNKLPIHFSCMHCKRVVHDNYEQE